jgi:N-methylhydantoinase B
MSTTIQADHSQTLVAASGVDPVTFEVIRHKLTSIVVQQSSVLKAVSGSPLVTEANDCNTGIYLPDGEVVALGPHIIFHAGSMELVVGHVLADCEETVGIGEGDAFITNDPYKGALHLPDVTIVEPVVVDGKRIAWVGGCAHMLDVGGMVASSLSVRATEVQQEGLRLPPTKLVEGGKLRDDVWNLILAASRLPDNLALGLKAMLAANKHGRDGLVRLAERYGVETVTAVMRTMTDISEAQVRERLRQLPDGVFRARNYLDHDGHANRLYNVQVEMTKRGDALTFDYNDSSPQAPGFVNCTESGLRGGVFAAILTMLAPDIPWNSGVMRVVDVVARKGLVINAAYPAPCAQATLGGAFMSQVTAVAAVSQLVAHSDALRDEAMASTKGSMSMMHLGGLDQYGEGFGGAITEQMMGGGGATSWHAGVDYAGMRESPSYQVTNVESDESHYPLLWLARYARTDSGGPGRQSGGITGGSAWTIHKAPIPVHGVLASHGVQSPVNQGLFGGRPGSTNRFRIVRRSDLAERLRHGVTALDQIQGDRELLGAKPGSLTIATGDVVGWEWDGGGGWGDAIEADPAVVHAAVLDGVISLQAANDYYAVVITSRGVDLEATAEARRAKRDERRAWEVPGRRTGRVDARHAEVRYGDHLVHVGDVVACDCGQSLAAVGENWKDGAAHLRGAAASLGTHVVLHDELEAHLYACPGCGVLLGIEVRRESESALHDAQLAPRGAGRTES